MTEPLNQTHEFSGRRGSAPRERAESEGAVWLARSDAGLTAQEREQFERWFEADPLNAEAWTRLKAAWDVFDRPRRSGDAPALVRELAARRRRRAWKVVFGAGAAAVAATAAALVFVPVRPAPHPAVAETIATNAVILRPEQRVLADGSVVDLNQGARIDVDFRPDVRDVRLLNGEAHFTVTKNPERPFVVTADGVRVRAVGTAFAVKLESEDVNLLVTEGSVTVNRPAGSQAPVQSGSGAPMVVSAGGLLVVPTSARSSGDPLFVRVLQAPEIESRLAWRKPCIELAGTPLAEAIALFNRGGSLHLSIDDPQLAQLRMSGVFRADNAEGFVRLLESNYGVRVERRGGSEVVLRGIP
ncbi:MAG: FecR domain-containing protein [Opitutaceae bacterium]